MAEKSHGNNARWNDGRRRGLVGDSAVAVSGTPLEYVELWSGDSGASVECASSQSAVGPGIAGRNRNVPLPGFEGLENAYSPCLSADLKTIVFGHLTDGKTWFDLYIATRDKVEEPFGPPRLLLGCQSDELDAYPALSPN